MKFISLSHSLLASAAILFLSSCAGQESVSQEKRVFRLVKDYPMFESQSDQKSPHMRVEIDCEFFPKNEAFNMEILRTVWDVSDTTKSPEVTIRACIAEEVKKYQAHKETYKQFVNEDGSYPPSTYAEFFVKVAQIEPWEKIHPVCIAFYEYTGGAHGNHKKCYLNFDVALGKSLTLKDFFEKKDEAELKKLLVKNDPRKVSNYGGENSYPARPYPVENFFVRKDGISFFYDPYSIAPYSEGTIEVFVPWIELRPLLKKTAPAGLR